MDDGRTAKGEHVKKRRQREHGEFKKTTVDARQPPSFGHPGPRCAEMFLFGSHL
jgi:hypothetical protein